MDFANLVPYIITIVGSGIVILCIQAFRADLKDTKYRKLNGLPPRKVRRSRNNGSDDDRWMGETDSERESRYSASGHYD